MALESTGIAHWEGDLMSGSGTTSLESSGAAGPLPISWKARTEEHGGLTSPEELLAAAHASCFSMAFSNILAKAGTPPEFLNTSATATFVPGDGITGIALTVKGRPRHQRGGLHRLRRVRQGELPGFEGPLGANHYRGAPRLSHAEPEED